MHKFLEQKTFAVIGASNNEDSFGYKICQSLLNHDYQLVPISIKNQTIMGQTCYASIRDYKGQVDVADFVINPNIGIKVLDEVISSGVKMIILQPGARSIELVEKAEAAGIKVLENCLYEMLSEL